MQATLRAYYRLTKPGIIYSNVLAAVAGLLLASRWQLSVWLLVGVIIGVGLIIASACVCNNMIDIAIDTIMSRTKQRPLVTGVISRSQAGSYAAILGIIGYTVLGLSTNALTVYIGIIASVFYVVIYGIAKRHTVFGTLVGSVSGALPPVAGYVAFTNRIDMTAFLLFLIWVAWQMPHFYAIAMYRRQDYSLANLPVLPVVRSIKVTRYQIMGYVAAFTILACAMTIIGPTGYIYLGVMAVVGIGWFGLGIMNWSQKKPEQWARAMFFYSLITMLVLCLMLSVGALIA